MQKKKTLNVSNLFVVSLLFIMFTSLFVVAPVATADTSLANEERGLLFVSNVLPFDMTKYSITTTDASMSSIDDYKEHFVYTLNAGEESTILINVNFQNNILDDCSIRSSTGLVFIDESKVNSPKGLLERYQTFTGEDLSDMIAAIDTADATSGNIELQISSSQLGGSDTSYVYFNWHTVINGVNYYSLRFTYKNGAFFSLSDNRGRATLGCTDVNISADDAVELALQYQKTFSYKAVTGPRDNPFYVDVFVGNYTVDMSWVSCKLSTYYVEPSVLGPCYYLQLPLEGTNSALWALSVMVDAVTGKIVNGQPMVLAVVGDWSLVGTGTGSSSAYSIVKTTSTVTYADTVQSLNLYDDGKGAFEALSETADVLFSESLSDTSFDVRIVALIVVVLMMIVAVPIVIIIAVKKRGK
jgi:hypothetical protein